MQADGSFLNHDTYLCKVQLSTVGSRDRVYYMKTRSEMASRLRTFSLETTQSWGLQLAEVARKDSSSLRMEVMRDRYSTPHSKGILTEFQLNRRLPRANTCLANLDKAKGLTVRLTKLTVRPTTVRVEGKKQSPAGGPRASRPQESQSSTIIPWFQVQILIQVALR